MTRAGCGLIALALLASPAFAQSPAQVSTPAPGMPGEPAFVEHRLALQLSDADQAKQGLVLSVSANLLKVYGPDKLAIEIVAFGPGIALLREGNPNAAKIRSLVSQGVRFDACMNTVATIERDTGKPYPLSPEARKVEAGVAQLLTLTEHGYTIVRP